VATVTSEPAVARPVETDALAVVLVIATIALIPVARTWILWSAPGGSGDLTQSVSTSPFDWPLAMLVVLQVGSVLRQPTRLRPLVAGLPLPARLLAITLAWLVVSASINPSWRAVDLAFRVAGAWAVVRTARRATRLEQDLMLGAVVAVGVSQALLGIAQSRTGDVLGLGLLEFDGPLYTFGEASAGRASLTHPYHLTALLVVDAAAAAVLAQRRAGAARRIALAALAVIGVAIPLTFSRAAVLAVVPMLLLWGRRRGSRPVAVVFAAGLALGALAGLDGIAAKSGQTVEVETADSGRRDRLAEAWRLVEDAPLAGVGPGRYVIALREVEHIELLPPHNVVAQVAAEAGVPGGALTLATLTAFAWWLVRRRATVVAAGVSLLPFHLLDSYPHVFPLGILITGMWLAVLAIAVDDERAGSPIR